MPLSVQLTLFRYVCSDQLHCLPMFHFPCAIPRRDGDESTQGEPFFFVENESGTDYYLELL